MKSGKQRREEIKAKRLQRLEKHTTASATGIGLNTSLGAVLSDATRLAPNNSYGVWPKLYLDRPFVCCGCGSHELWTAKQQKWWYEIAQGSIYSNAVRCRPCRIAVRDRVDEARRVSLAGMVRKLEQKKLKE
jgi:Probable zinc-ribbon domain